MKWSTQRFWDWVYQKTAKAEQRKEMADQIERDSVCWPVPMRKLRDTAEHPLLYHD